uniref:Uncharacterized protein n=1 Tax=Rhizophora mucronata TaxID=61149 RepID=A0A2P2M1U4_RHIMU
MSKLLSTSVGVSFKYMGSLVNWFSLKHKIYWHYGRLLIGRFSNFPQALLS